MNDQIREKLFFLCDSKFQSYMIVHHTKSHASHKKVARDRTGGMMRDEIGTKTEGALTRRPPRLDGDIFGSGLTVKNTGDWRLRCGGFGGGMVWI
jgi:hypothetical protein